MLESESFGKLKQIKLYIYGLKKIYLSYNMNSEIYSKPIIKLCAIKPHSQKV